MNQIIIEITWFTAVNKINNDESSKMQILLKIIAKTVLNAATHGAKTFRVTWVGSMIIWITTTLFQGSQGRSSIGYYK